MKLITLILFSIFYTSSCAQIIDYSHQSFRDGDNLTKYEIKNVVKVQNDTSFVVDLSDIAIRKKHSHNYSVLPDSINSFCLTTLGNRNYFYQTKSNIIFEGFENNKLKIRYSKPIDYLKFPFQFGDGISGLFCGEGTYCDKIYVQTYGKYVTCADAVGCIVLPSGDTIKNSMCIHMNKQVMYSYQPSKDSKQLFMIPDDSIRNKINLNDSVINEHSFFWYVPGYRYPILEFKVAGSNLNTGIYYYYPLDEQLSLMLDDDNMKVRSQIHNLSFEDTSENDTDTFPVHYNIINNKQIKSVTIDYEMNADSNVSFIISDFTGNVFKHVERYGKNGEKETVTINYSDLRRDHYIITISAGNKNVSEKFTVE